MKVSKSTGRTLTRIVSVAALAAVAVLVVVCVMTMLRLPESVMVPQHRFVDPATRAAEAESMDNECRNTIAFPVEQLLDETRYALAPPPHAAVVYSESYLVPPDRRVSFYPELPEALQNAGKLALAPQIRQGKRWTRLPDFVAETEIVGGRRHVRVTLDVPADAGAGIGIVVEGYAVAGPKSSHRTAEILIPNQAYLAFAMGVERPAWAQGPVAFSIKTCAGDSCNPLFSEVIDPRSDKGRGWRDRRTPLDLLAGRTVSFLFETQLETDDPTGVSLPRWANPTVYAPRSRRHDEVNVILLSVDTLSAKHLRTYGYEHDTAPFIEETFGKHGTVFERCIAAATTTAPSHMSVFTSVPPNAHGVGTTSAMKALPAWLLTLAEILRGAGFETGAVTEDGWLATGTGFGRGFNSYAENKSPEALTEPTGQILQTFAKARQWLTVNRDKRFFLFLHTYQVHHPYVPPSKYDRLFAEHDGQAVTDQSPLHLRDLVAYDREIRYSDDELRQLFQTIRELGLSRDTVFILMSDHGEEFLEHGRLEHGAQLYDEVTRVPLMFWGPGRIPEGRRVRTPVSLMDIMPTILEIAGVPLPPQVQGLSLTAQIFERSDGNIREIFSEAWAPYAIGPNNERLSVSPPAYLVQLGTKKLMRYRRESGVEYEYYDLSDDPAEQKDLAPETIAGVRDLRAQLDAYETNCEVAVRKLAVHGATASPTPGVAHLSPEEEEKLHALGYIQ